MDNNNKNLKVFFSESTAPIIADIVAKYNLDETLEEALKKTTQAQLLNTGIILKVTKEAVLDNEIKKNLNTVLEKELKVSADTANSIAEDIKNKLISMASISSADNDHKDIKIPHAEYPKEEQRNKKEVSNPTFNTMAQKPQNTKNVIKKDDKYRESV